MRDAILAGSLCVTRPRLRALVIEEERQIWSDLAKYDMFDANTPAPKPVPGAANEDMPTKRSE